MQILVPWPGIKPVPPALEVQSLNHWTFREVQLYFIFKKMVKWGKKQWAKFMQQKQERLSHLNNSESYLHVSWMNFY